MKTTTQLVLVPPKVTQKNHKNNWKTNQEQKNKNTHSHTACPSATNRHTKVKGKQIQEKRQRQIQNKNKYTHKHSPTKWPPHKNKCKCKWPNICGSQNLIICLNLVRAWVKICLLLCRSTWLVLVKSIFTHQPKFSILFHLSLIAFEECPFSGESLLNGKEIRGNCRQTSYLIFFNISVKFEHRLKTLLSQNQCGKKKLFSRKTFLV